MSSSRSSIPAPPLESHDSLPLHGCTISYLLSTPPSPSSPALSLPILLIIPPANGTTSLYEPLLTTPLAKKFTLCLYDRRGFRRSSFIPPLSSSDFSSPPDSNDLTHHPYLATGQTRMKRDADDAALLARHLLQLRKNGGPGSASAETGVYVFGTSSGARVTMELLSHYPELITRVVLHEPPVLDPGLNVLPPAESFRDEQGKSGGARKAWEENLRLLAKFGSVQARFTGLPAGAHWGAGAGGAAVPEQQHQDQHEEAGTGNVRVGWRDVVEAFVSAVGTDEDEQVLREYMLDAANEADTRFFLMYEAGSAPGLGYGAVKIDYARLAEINRVARDGEGEEQHGNAGTRKEKIVFAVGKGNRGRLVYQGTEAIARKIGGGVEVEEISGGHMSYWSAPEVFAEEVERLLLGDGS